MSSAEKTLNPRNAGAWAPALVPETGDGASRYAAITSSPEGWPAAAPGVPMAEAFRRLVNDLLEERAPMPVTIRKVHHWFVHRDNNGQWVKKTRGSTVDLQVAENQRPTKQHKALKLRGGALLDSAFLQEGEGWEVAHDEELWDALLQMFEELPYTPTTKAIRGINDELSRLLILRAGLADVPVYRLLTIGREHQ